jgi:hypothetical protein
MADIAVYCERCGHPHDRDDKTGCYMPTVKGKDCLCPKFVRPTGGPLASFSRYLKKESHRAGFTPPPDEGAVV